MYDPQTLASEISAHLRGREGLTAASLSGCPTVLGALEASDPADGVLRLRRVIEQMPQSKWLDALSYALRISQKGPDLLSKRREEFAAMNSVGEEAVKKWENRGIKMLSDRLAAESIEQVIFIRQIYEVDDNKLTMVHEWNFVESGFDTYKKKYKSRKNSDGVFRLPLVFHQIQEPIQDLQILVIFPRDQAPGNIFAIREAEDPWSLISGSFKYSLVRLMESQASLLEDMNPEDRIWWKESMENHYAYAANWDHPKVGKYYGLFWIRSEV